MTTAAKRKGDAAELEVARRIADTYVTPDGRRQCKTCQRVRTLAWQRRAP